MESAADITRRSEYQEARADGKRQAFAEVLDKIDELGGNPVYRKAGKRIAIEVVKMLKLVNRTATQA